jgi:hypothetical protein
MGNPGLQKIVEGLRTNFEKTDVQSQVLFMNCFFDLVRFSTSDAYVTPSYKLHYNPTHKMDADYLLRKGGVLHAGVQKMYVKHIPGLVLDGKLAQMGALSIDSKTLDLYRKKLSGFFQKLWEKSEIYKMDGVYFCLNSKEIFWVEDLTQRHIA